MRPSYKRQWKYALSITLALLLLATSGYGGLKKVGQSAMQSLKFLNGSRTMAMGNTGIALPQYDANSMFINPGTITAIDETAVSFNYSDYFLDMGFGSVAAVRNLGNLGSLGLSASYFNYGEFEETMEGPGSQLGTGRTFTAGSYTVGLSYARKMTDRFSLGGHVMYAYEDMDMGNDLADRWTDDNMDNISNVIMNFGTYYDTGFRNLRIAAVLQNFGTDIAYIDEKATMPMTFRLGASMVFPGVLGANNDLRITAESVNPRDYQERLHLGGEYMIDNLIALRAGYKYNYDLDSFTGGFGIHHGMGGVEYLIDFSYIMKSGPLSNMMSLSVGTLF